MKNIPALMFEKIAIELAQGAGQILLKYRHRAEVVKNKGRALDFATEADIESEKYLRKEIGKRFPDHGFIGEEEGETNLDAEYVWILDPLDGTIDFIRGLPSFSVLIALEHKKNLIAGCVFNPVSGETFSSCRGSGVRKNGGVAQVSNISSLKESIVHFRVPRCANLPEEIDQTINILRKFAHRTGLIREFWVDSSCLANVAAGSVEGVVLTLVGPKWWDVAPGILLVLEGGGRVTDMYGNPIRNHDLSKGLVASNGKIHTELLKLINKDF